MVAACSTVGGALKRPASPPGRLDIAASDSGGFEDFEPLREHLKNVRIVQLGESSHGAREYFETKTRLIQFLHEELGFNVLAFESPVYQCNDAEQNADAWPARGILVNCVYGVWYTEEVLDLFEYIKSRRMSSRPLRFAGYDVQPIGQNKKGRPAFLGSVAGVVDPALEEPVRAFDQNVLDVYSKGSRPRREYFRKNRDELITFYADLYDRYDANIKQLDAHFAGSANPAAGLVARQTALSMLQYVRQQTSNSMTDYGEARDWGMAQNAIALAEEIYPNERVIIWAHNAHIRHNNQKIDPDGAEFIQARSAGYWLRAHFGDALFSIGLYARSGQMTDNAREVSAVTEVRPGSVEALPITAGASGVMLTAPQKQASLWDQPVTAKYAGKTDVELTLREQYDAIILLDNVSPPRYLEF